MCFKLSKRILNTDEVLPVVVLLLDLLVEAMHNPTLQDVGIVCSLHVAAVRVKRRRVLTKELNVLLSMGTRLVDSLTALASSLGQLLALVLNFRVEAIEDG
jgi:hypothetical protein